MSDYDRHRPKVKTTEKPVDKPKADRYNQGKIRPSLLPVEVREAMLRVLEKGAIKYSLNNWKKGDMFSSILDSTERHIMKMCRGELIDKESGELHAAHAAVNLGFLIYFIETGRTELNDLASNPKEST